MYAMILAGGSGTRLWPLSRELFPKQYLALLDDGQSLFQATVDRVLAATSEDKMLVVTHVDQTGEIKRQLGLSGRDKVRLLAEPQARNTAPAIALAAWYLLREAGPETIMAVLPSDHLIPDRNAFAALMQSGAEAAAAYGLVTFGIEPAYPETGYGYICRGDKLAGAAFRVDKFVEKPDLQTAKAYLEDPRYLWNSGMFVFRVGALIDEYRRLLPEMHAALDKLDYQSAGEAEIAEVYAGLEKISIDYGILERAADVSVVPTSIGWSDLGSWEAYYRITGKDEHGNAVKGNSIVEDSENSLIYSTSRLVGAVGLKNTVVIETDDALLVCHRDRTQDVKKVVDRLAAREAKEAREHRTVFRPWGSYTSLELGATYQVKRINVNPGSRLSLQSHRHRAEHWVVVAGEALVTLDDRQIVVRKGEHIFIPTGARHRMENQGTDDLVFIEVQNGDYLGEDDIERYEDDYGRTGADDTAGKETGTGEGGEGGAGLRETGPSGAVPGETGSRETGSRETESRETGSRETGSREAGSREAGSREAGSREAGSRETESREAGSREAGSREVGTKEPGTGAAAPGDTGFGAQPSISIDLDAPMARDHYERWLARPDLDPEMKAELEAMEKDPAAIESHFGSELSFGTGGMRGVIGPGLNRINCYTIRRATQGLADYLKSQYAFIPTAGFTSSGVSPGAAAATSGHGSNGVTGVSGSTGATSFPGSTSTADVPGASGATDAADTTDVESVPGAKDVHGAPDATGAPEASHASGTSHKTYTPGSAEDPNDAHAKFNEENKPLKVAIAYDTRHYSDQFAEAAALVLAANGIKALLFSDIRPTPMLSYTTRELGCAAGIVITASHNPPQYNGYKIYGPDGGQAVSPLVDYVISAIAKVDIFEDVLSMNRVEAVSAGLLETVDPALDRAYLERINALSLSSPKACVKVVFTPLHGTGSVYIPNLLEGAGCVDLVVVEEQNAPDPDFSTVRVPNPEDPAALDMALDKARRVEADLVLATDPDGDRVGTAVRARPGGDFVILSGNQVGALLIEYICSHLYAGNAMPAEPALIKTIVTGDLGSKVAAAYGLQTFNTLTGFKFIGEKIEAFKRAGRPNFVFGYEESCGYLTGTFVRDKDAVIASLLITEMTAYYKDQGKTLLQVLEEMQQRHGYHREALLTVELKDISEADRHVAAFHDLPPEIAGVKITQKRDYDRRKGWDFAQNREFPLTLPRSQVLHFTLADGSWFAVRPSGTEPKVKFYLSTTAPTAAEAEEKLARLKDAVER